MATLVAESEEEAKKMDSQMKIIIRAMYSNPPINPARIVFEILNDEHLYKMWLKDIRTMSDRVMSVRKSLRANLEKLGSSRKWDHITNQIGMFCYSGLNKEQVMKLRKEYAIYMTMDGRISVVGVTSKNVDYLAEAIHAVTK